MSFESPSERFWRRLKRFVLFRSLDSYNLARTAWYAVLFVTALKVALQAIRGIALIYSESARLSSAPMVVGQPDFIFNTTWSMFESLMNAAVYLLFVRLILDVALRILSPGVPVLPKDGT
jgi:hypothetical protein